MAGKVVAPTTIARPWEERWQFWKQRKKSNGWQLEPLAQKSSPSAETLCAVPARLVVALPFWVEATEPETVKSIALLEVEMKGLASSERLASDVFITSLWSEGERTLVRATIFPAELKLPPDAPSVEFYEPSPLLMALSGDTVHLWREFDELVAVVIWRDQIVCWETIHWPASPREVQIWLRCLVLQLRIELQLTDSLRLKEWTPVFDEIPSEFIRDEVASESDRVEGPAVVLPTKPFGWMPLTTKLIQRSRRQKELLTAIGLGVAVLIVCSLVVVFFLQWQMSRKIAARDAEIAQLETEVAPLREAASRWAEVEPSVDDRYFPIEMLHLLVAAMPENGVRLTAFEMSPTQVLVEGEATQVSAAAEYFQKIQEGEAGSTGLTWNMPPPSLQANNTAKFVINGTRGQ
jgi:hypothetical protein